MTYQSHLAWAAAAGLLFWPYAPPDDMDSGRIFAFWMALASLGGLLPDIDHPKSWLGRLIPVLPELLFRTTGHRGWTHSLFALALYAGAVWSLFMILYGVVALAHLMALGAALGFGSHLLGDFITNRGVPLLWPLADRIGAPVCTTGSPTERTLTIGVVLAGSWMAIQMGRPLLAV